MRPGTRLKAVGTEFDIIWPQYMRPPASLFLTSSASFASLAFVASASFSISSLGAAFLRTVAGSPPPSVMVARAEESEDCAAEMLRQGESGDSRRG